MKYAFWASNGSKSFNIKLEEKFNYQYKQNVQENLKDKTIMRAYVKVFRKFDFVCIPTLKFLWKYFACIVNEISLLI